MSQPTRRAVLTAAAVLAAPAVLRAQPAPMKLGMVKLGILQPVTGALAQDGNLHEDGLLGSGLAKLMQAEPPKRGFEILDTVAHPTPARDMGNVALRIRSLAPDLILPPDCYAEFVLLARTLQQRIKPIGIHGVLNGAASSTRFVKEYPGLAEGLLDCNHWADPRNPKTEALRRTVEAQGKSFAYNVTLNRSCVLPVADALSRAGSADRAKLTEALAGSSLSGHIMPYGPTRFVGGQNEGATPVNTQVQGGDIKVIFPAAFRRQARVPRGPTHGVHSPAIIAEAVVNGMLTGAVHALVALGSR